MDNKDFVLKPDTDCHVELTIEDGGFDAIFKGYASLGGDVAMIFDCSGKMRFVPISQIVYIETNSLTQEEQPKKIDIYYR